MRNHKTLTKPYICYGPITLHVVKENFTYPKKTQYADDVLAWHWVIDVTAKNTWRTVKGHAWEMNRKNNNSELIALDNPGDV